ncbi:MAG TPA: TlpA disulfide reductase family protein [Bacteroidia bacterium]|nr:TlpA disulfide reductase family protein [Bacteroidia bacterium]
MIFPIKNDTLNLLINFAENKMQFDVKHDQLYKYLNLYNSKYRRNNGFDSTYRVIIKSEFKDFINQLDFLYSKRIREVDSVSLVLNCPNSFTRFLKMNTKYEYFSKKYDYLMNHSYYKNNVDDYFLADSNFYANFPKNAFNDSVVEFPDYGYYVKAFIDDYYFRSVAKKVEIKSKSKFMFSYAKSELKGKTRDLAIALIIKELIDNASNVEDFNKAENLLKEFESFNTDKKYIAFIKAYFIKKNTFKNKVNFCLPDTNNIEFCLNNLIGKNIVIFLHGTWCGPCKKQIPFLEKIINSNTHSDIVFIYISLENNNIKKWKDYVRNKKLHGINLYAEGNFQSKELSGFNISFVPRVLLIDKKGYLINANANAPSDGLAEQINQSFNY